MTVFRGSPWRLSKRSGETLLCTNIKALFNTLMDSLCPSVFPAASVGGVEEEAGGSGSDLNKKKKPLHLAWHWIIVYKNTERSLNVWKKFVLPRLCGKTAKLYRFSPMSRLTSALMPPKRSSGSSTGQPQVKMIKVGSPLDQDFSAESLEDRYRMAAESSHPHLPTNEVHENELNLTFPPTEKATVAILTYCFVNDFLEI